MMPPQQERRSQRRKRKHASSPSRENTPPGFWDRLSRVPLCRRALREFNRRAVQPIAPKQPAKRDVEDSQAKQLQRFARRGGPDLRSIQGYPEQEPRVKMITKPTRLSAKDSAFVQALLDNGIHPYDRGQKPNNWEEIQERLAQPRPSLSPSQFSNGAFEEFQLKNEEALNEAAVMIQVFPMITGKANIPSGYDQLFSNLKALNDDISNPKPYYFNGSRTAEIRPKVRDDLGQYIIPSTQQYRTALPNFFAEVKGPDGMASEARSQITQDLAAGARGMLKMQSYKLDEPVFDNNAYTFGSTYQSGYLQLYAMHPTKPGDVDGKPEYHTTIINDSGLVGNLVSHRQGIAAFRNLQDFAKEKRDEFIARANERADNDDEPEASSADPDLTSFIPTSQSELFTADSHHEESGSTSADELAMPALPIKKRIKAH